MSRVSSPEMPRAALLIGAYGGEHIGDAAILGGVLLRLSRRGHIDRALVGSFRPDRTRQIMSSIEPAVPLEVVRHDLASIRQNLHRTHLVVWAGGPIGDWPRLLARNLATAAAARARGMPVVLEGIGIGRLRRRTSTAMVAALLERATATTVRSAAAAATVTRLVGRPPAVAADPAFDYIATRIACDRMSARERQALDELALRSPAARLICINARPATRRRAAVAAALSRLARIMVEFARIHPVRYVFFPLETETNTGRDLDAAEELARHLPADVDFRVWPDRPSVDGTLALLRGADAAVTMRFHAAVFALSQGVPTVGIDFYHAGVPGKVTDLFDELREGACVFDIANIDPDRVVRLLVELTAAHRGDFAKRAD